MHLNQPGVVLGSNPCGCRISQRQAQHRRGERLAFVAGGVSTARNPVVDRVAEFLKQDGRHPARVRATVEPGRVDIDAFLAGVPDGGVAGQGAPEPSTINDFHLNGNTARCQVFRDNPHRLRAAGCRKNVPPIGRSRLAYC